MIAIEKQSWMSDKHWKAFFAVLNSGLTDININENDDIVPQEPRTEITAEEKAILDDLISKCSTTWTSQEYARKRQAEYPSIEELVVALYDTDDKSAIEAKRAEVKKKYPKPE